MSISSVVQNLSQGILYQTSKRSGIFTVDTTSYQLSWTSMALIATAMTHGAGSVYSLLTPTQSKISYGAIGTVWLFSGWKSDAWNHFSGTKRKNVCLYLLQRTKKRKWNVMGLPKIFNYYVRTAADWLFIVGLIVGVYIGINYMNDSIETIKTVTKNKRIEKRFVLLPPSKKSRF